MQTLVAIQGPEYVMGRIHAYQGRHPNQVVLLALASFTWKRTLGA